jgi:hypothetical protein
MVLKFWIGSNPQVFIEFRQNLTNFVTLLRRLLLQAWPNSPANQTGSQNCPPPIFWFFCKNLETGQIASQNSKMNLNEIDQTEMVSRIVFIVYRSFFMV